MGVFLAGPLLEQLSTASSGSVVEAQRVLEILVPLVYRPALKVTIPALMALFNWSLSAGLTALC